jgi:hypothetical protein
VREQIADENWLDLKAEIIAAHDGNQAEFLAATTEFTSEHDLRGQRLAGLCAFYLLRHAVAEALGRRPEESDLRRLADDQKATFRRLLPNSDPDLLFATLATAYKLPGVPPVTGGRFAVSSTAALGVLLNEPDADLDRMRPHLAEWLSTHADSVNDVVGPPDR